MRTLCLRLSSIFVFLFLLFQTTEGHSIDLDLNGFGSIYLAQATNQNLLPKYFSNTFADFTDFSLMGLNIAGKVSSDLEFASQLLAQGATTSATTSYNISAQWVFLNYRASDSIQVKFGRQLFPFFIGSEYVSVGYLLPYRSIPTLTYGLVPFNSIDGVGVVYNVGTSIGNLTAELFGGTPVIVIPTGVSTVFSDLVGLAVTLDGGWFRLHGAAMVDFEQDSSSVTGSTFSQGGHVQHCSIGYKLEKYSIVSWGEFAYLYTPDSAAIPPNFGPFGPTQGGTFLGWGQSTYVLGGYRLGKFLPRYTYSQGDFRGGIVDGAATTHIIGLNYQFTQQSVIKGEYQWDLIPTGRSTYVDTQSVANPAYSGNAFYAGVDFIF